MRYLFSRYAKLNTPTEVLALIKTSLGYPLQNYNPQWGLNVVISSNYPRAEDLLTVFNTNLSAIRKRDFIKSKSTTPYRLKLDDFLTTSNDTPLKLKPLLFQLFVLYNAWVEEYNQLDLDRARYYRRHLTKIELDLIQLLAALDTMPW